MPLVPGVPDPPFRTGAPYWYWHGGRPAIDFVNTLRERWNRRIDCLVSDEDVVGWLAAAGLLPGACPAPDGLLAEARGLREAIDRGVQAAIDGSPPRAGDVRLIDDWLVLAGARPQLRLDGSGSVILTERPAADSPRRALGMIALDAATVLGTSERSRLRICASATCSARFFDRSPAGRRRWCSMQSCGNVAKARRHRAKGDTPA